MEGHVLLEWGGGDMDRVESAWIAWKSEWKDEVLLKTSQEILNQNWKNSLNSRWGLEGRGSR